MITIPEIFLPLPAFGWDTHTRTEAGRAQCSGASVRFESDYMERSGGGFLGNVSKVASYIPGINVIVGIARVVLFSSLLIAEPETESERFIEVMQLLRGIAEILAGPLLLIVDAIKTIYDYCLAERYLNEGIVPE